jgi:hypothetical protein
MSRHTDISINIRVAPQLNAIASVIQVVGRVTTPTSMFEQRMLTNHFIRHQMVSDMVRKHVPASLARKTPAKRSRPRDAIASLHAFENLTCFDVVIQLRKSI